MRTTGLMLILAGGLVVLPACAGEGPLSGDELPRLSVTRVSDGIRIVNGTDEAFAYTVWNRNWLGLFAPCVDTTPECLRVGPRDTVFVADTDIVGYAPGIFEVVVRWWRVRPDGTGGYRASEVRELVVGL